MGVGKPVFNGSLERGLSPVLLIVEGLSVKVCPEFYGGSLGRINILNVTHF